MAAKVATFLTLFCETALKRKKTPNKSKTTGMRAKMTVDNYSCLKGFAVKRGTQCTCGTTDVFLTET